MSRIGVLSTALRTPLGDRPAAALDRLLRGERAIGPHSLLPPVYPAALSARVPGDPLPCPQARFLGRVGLFALEVAREAAAGWAGDRDRLGVFMGIGGLRALWNELLPAMVHQRPDGEGAWARGLKQVHPYWMLRHLSNNAHALISIELEARGDGVTCAGAIGGLMALEAALRALRADALDAALVIGADSLIEPELLVEGYASGRWAEGRAPGEAAAAVLLARDRGLGSLTVRTAHTTAATVPAASTLEGLGPGRRIDLDGATGELGAATGLVQLVIMAELLGRGHGGPIEGRSGGSPDQAGWLRLGPT